jgi:MoaA/NifB/PqqE/SkfB family radical SAM enzyme
MDLGEHIHWFLTSKCNIECSYCFKPDNSTDESIENLERLAQLLVKNDVQMVTIGGGEPMIVKELDKILRILKEGGIYVSLHTNGMFLNQKRLDELSGLVDDIGLPIDSIDSKIQQRLRGNHFMKVHKRIFELAKAIQKRKIAVGYHTVFTALNHQEIPVMYPHIRDNGFKYWRIYQFNDRLAFMRLLNKKVEHTDDIIRLFEQKYQEIDILRGTGTKEKAFTDCLLAHFLLTEKSMRRYHNKKVQFVGDREYKPTYVFLKNNGDLLYYLWSSDRERIKLGNLFKNRFSTIKNRFIQLEANPASFNPCNFEDFFNTEQELPIWARIWLGNYYIEELDEVPEEQFRDMITLHNLYIQREKKTFI